MAGYDYGNVGYTTNTNQMPYYGPVSSPAPGPTPTSQPITTGAGGGGGGGWGTTTKAPTSGTGTKVASTAPTQQQLDQQAAQAEAARIAQQQAVLQGQVNDAFAPNDTLLSQMLNGFQGQEQNYYDQATKPYDAQLPLLTQARDEFLTQNTQNLNLNEANRQNALADARRQFQELSYGNQQRFGGDNSTSQFASDLTGREYMRGVGNTNNTAGQNAYQLNNQALNLNKEYQNKLQSVTLQKEAALAQAKTDFQDRLRQIQGLQLQNNQAKAQLQLQALQELRSRIQTVNDQATAFQQQQQSLYNQGLANISQAIAQYQAYAGTPVNLQNLPIAQFSQYGGIQGGGGGNTQQGYVRGGVRYDPITGQPIV